MAVPVILFAYARPAHLARVLAGLRENAVPLIHAFCDGAKGEADATAVTETRRLLRAIDWCEVRITERTENLGLGRNVLAGVSEIAAQYEAFIVWEDDLVCVPGTYAWVCAALRQYAGDDRVMSVTAWTHPRVTPAEVGEQPYFDARAECWVWGAWARSWRGMKNETALKKMADVEERGLSPDACGADLPRMARDEARKNIWAVRWLYHHLQHGGLCVRPPWSMVEHIGFDATATNASSASEWANPALRTAPPIPSTWPEPREHPGCRTLWQVANSPLSSGRRLRRKLASCVRALKNFAPVRLRLTLHSVFGWRWFRGDYASWRDARVAARGYADDVIFAKVLAATLAVSRGEAAYEQDGVLFPKSMPDLPLLAALQKVREAGGDRLRVVDFGGALGSTYWRHREWLSRVPALRWDVVEQAQFVAAGRRHFPAGPLRFFGSVAEAAADGPRDLLLCSTTLQYLEDPFAMVEAWQAGGWDFLLFNNLPLHSGRPDRLRVQHVPPQIYPASYPVWFFNREKFIACFAPRYELVSEFRSEAVWPVDRRSYGSTGLLFKRRNPA